MTIPILRHVTNLTEVEAEKDEPMKAALDKVPTRRKRGEIYNTVLYFFVDDAQQPQKQSVYFTVRDFTYYCC